MGFLDKVKTQAEQTLKQGQEKVGEVQAKKKADGLLRDLGAWHYATDTGRDDGKGPAEMARITAELQAHEAEHGPLGGRDDDPEPPPPADAGVPTAPPTSAPPTSPPPTSPPPPGGSDVPPPPPPGDPGPVPPPPGVPEPPAPLPPLGGEPMPGAPPGSVPGAI